MGYDRENINYRIDILLLKTLSGMKLITNIIIKPLSFQKICSYAVVAFHDNVA